MPSSHPRFTALAGIALAAWLSGCAGAQATPRSGLPSPSRTHSAPAASPAARVAVLRGVEYARAGEISLLADILLPEPRAAPRLPAVIYIHGGSWKQGSREQG